MKTRALSIIALVAVAIFIGSASFANVPPPPANQLIGVDDTLFNDQTEAQCRVCHENVPDTHHLLYGTTIPFPGGLCSVGTCSISGAYCGTGLACAAGAGTCVYESCLSSSQCELPINVCNMSGAACPVGTCSISTTISCTVDSDCPSGELCDVADCPISGNVRNGEVCGQPYCPNGSAVVDPDGNSDGANDTVYGCLSCHEQQLVGGVLTFIVTRDCLVCHAQNPNGPTVHHRDGGDAKAGICTSCHGDIVDDSPGCKQLVCGTGRGGTQNIPCTTNADCTAALVPQKICNTTGEPCTVNADCPLTGGSTQTCVNQLWCGYYDGSDTCDDGHVIPSYAPSMVTPVPSQHAHECAVSLAPCEFNTQCEEGTCSISTTIGCYEDSECPTGETCVGAELCVAIEPEQVIAGGCNYCHDAGLDTASGVDVFNNHDTHHDIFLHKNNSGGNLTQICAWCHKAGYPHVVPGETPDRIRWCENCHGYESLHNIQADSPKSPTGTIVVGGEDAYWGHVGKDNPADPNNDSDCWGCHAFPPLSMASAPGTGAIIPSLAGSSAATITAGAETAITLTGTAFTNITGTTQYTSNVEVTAADGGSIIVTPDAISVDSLMATLPALSAGLYEVRIVKDTVKSNPVVINCVPKVEITSVTCADGDLIVTGSGFGDEPPAGAEEFINCKLDGATLAIVSWSDTQIVATTAACGEAVTVNTLYGSASYGAAASPCAANFDEDTDVDGSDASTFKGDFGRSSMQNPCASGSLCDGDFNCDGDVDGSDASGFKAQFGRGGLNSPCAAVPVANCSY